MINRRRKLDGPFRPFGNLGWVVRAPSGGDDNAHPYKSQMCLFEDSTRFTNAHMPHLAIDRLGGGRYSHWGQQLFFSTSDGTDPNSNGRAYSFDFSLDFETWNHERLARATQQWNLHPRKNYFRSRGGEHVPPPFACNIGLTNKCNLRCEICGSQKYLDETGVRRRHMALTTFEAVAETIFPFLSIVELNSQGDPLLHPNIDTVLERIAEHRCEIKVQHNGTLLSDQLVDLLIQQHGTIMLSLDAVGAKFDEVRRGGVWSKAEPGLMRLLSQRNRRRLSVGLYPTLTKRTIGEALNVVEWSARNGADLVAFHRYVPVPGAKESAPSDIEYDKLKEELKRWCVRNADPLRVSFESEFLNEKVPTPVRSEYASLEKASTPFFFLQTTPNDSPLGDPNLTCTAPRDYIEIGLEGQIAACCRSQDVRLGYATSVESFADAWFGSNYKKIRASLTRDARGPYPLPNCEGCIKFFAPKSAGKRRAVDYAEARAQLTDGLAFTTAKEIAIDEIRNETGQCYIAIVPPGLDASDWELWEDDRKLGPGNTLHDDIRKFGNGRYHIGVRSVYFSTSDGSNAQRNQRVYALRPKLPTTEAADVRHIEARSVSA